MPDCDRRDVGCGGERGPGAATDGIAYTTGRWRSANQFSFTWLYYPVCGPCAPEQLNVYGPPGTPCHGYYRETPFLQYNVGAGYGGHIRSFFGPHPGQGQLGPRRRRWCPGLYRGQITSGDPESFTPNPYVEYVFTFRVKAMR